MNMHLGKTRGKCGTGANLEMAFSMCTVWQDGFPGPLCWPFWVLCPLITKADSGTQSPGEEHEWTWPPPCAPQIWASGSNGKNYLQLCPVSLGPNSHGSQAHAIGQLHTSCSQFLGGKWCPWFESAPVENWIPLSSGELGLQSFPPEANSPSLGFTVFTSQLFLKHHSEWCRFFSCSIFLGPAFRLSHFCRPKYCRLTWLFSHLFVEDIGEQEQRPLFSTSKGCPHFVLSHPWPVVCEAGHTFIIHSPFTFDFFVVVQKGFICWFYRFSQHWPLGVGPSLP